jgi:methyl halide transferase
LGEDAVNSFINVSEVGVTPWHLGEPALGLQDFIQKVPLDGLFLVPGCGQGLDVQLLAKTRPTATVFGLDLSDLVIQNAKETINETNVKLISGDFFKTADLEKDSFSFIFDYTFLCAMQLHKRNDWANRMKELIKPGGMLMTLMFPLQDHDLEKGPPFPLSVETYYDLLRDGFKLESLEVCRSPPKRQGREKLAVWIRKST